MNYSKSYWESDSILAESASTGSSLFATDGGSSDVSDRVSNIGTLFNRVALTPRIEVTPAEELSNEEENNSQIDKEEANERLGFGVVRKMQIHNMVLKIQTNWRRERANPYLEVPNSTRSDESLAKLLANKNRSMANDTDTFGYWSLDTIKEGNVNLRYDYSLRNLARSKSISNVKISDEFHKSVTNVIIALNRDGGLLKLKPSTSSPLTATKFRNDAFSFQIDIWERIPRQIRYSENYHTDLEKGYSISDDGLLIEFIDRTGDRRKRFHDWWGKLKIIFRHKSLLQENERVDEELKRLAKDCLLMEYEKLQRLV